MASTHDERIDDEKLVSSVNPAAFENNELLIREIERAFALKLDTVMPGQVVSYDRNSHVAEVQPLVKIALCTVDGERYKSRNIVNVPVWRWQGGGYIVDTPLYPGETGLLFAGHRDSSLVIQHNSAHTQKPKRDKNGKFLKSVTGNEGPQPPNTYLLHRYENGFFLPFRFGTINLPTEDENALVIGRMSDDGSDIESVVKLTEDGGVYVQSSEDGGFKVVADENIDMDGMTPQTVTYLSDVKYDAATHKFTKTVKTMKAIVLSQSEKEETVFEAAPHKPCSYIG